MVAIAPLVLPITFAGLSPPSQPLADFDQNYVATQTTVNLLVAAVNAIQPSGVILLNKLLAPVTITNSAIETSLYNFSVPGGTLGTNGMLTMTALCDIVNTSGGALNVQFFARYGAAAVLATGNISIANSATPTSVLFEHRVAATGASNTQMGIARFSLGAQDGTGGAATPVFRTGSNNAMTIDSTAAQNFQVTAFLQTAAVTFTAKCYGGWVELV